MSTIGYDSWAVDLAEVGAVYPFQGSEGLFALAGIVLWLLWHVVQIRRENRHYNEVVSNHSGDVDSVIEEGH